MKINANLFLSLRFGDKTFPLEKNGFQQITLIENQRLLLTQGEIIMQDVDALFGNKIPLGDGVPVQIIVGRDESSAKTYNMRVFGKPGGVVSGVPVYRILMYGDNPLWVLGTTKTPYEGTSNQVLEKLAQESGLKYEGAPTADKMIWLPTNDRRCVFASRTAAQGFYDQQSCMAMGVGLDGVLRYRNLATMQLTPDVPLIIRGDAKSDKIWSAVAARAINSSGAGNSRGGYGQVTHEQSTLRTAQKFVSAQVKNMSEVLAHNTGLAKGLGSVVTKFAPIDAGNVPVTHQQGIYQNQRISRMYSTGYEVMMQVETPFKMFDIVRYVPQQEGYGTPEQDRSNTAFYMLAGRTVQVKGQNYGEKLSILTTGDSSSENEKQFQNALRAG